jgi:Bacterial RNA polymerase, alpha chain C terminal domain
MNRQQRRALQRKNPHSPVALVRPNGTSDAVEEPIEVDPLPPKADDRTFKYYGDEYYGDHTNGARQARRAYELYREAFNGEDGDPDSGLVPWEQLSLHGRSAWFHAIGASEYTWIQDAMNDEYNPDTSIDEIRLPKQARASLKKMGIRTLGDLAVKTEHEIYAIKSISNIAMDSLHRAMSFAGVRFRSYIRRDWSQPWTP